MNSKENNQAAPRGFKQLNRLVPTVLRPGNYILMRFQEFLNLVFGPALNPLYYLGAITFLFLWVLLATGVYLYLFYEMNPVGAYESVQYMTEDQKYYGGIIRSMHRYASDGMVIVIAIHMFQVFFSDRFRKYRWIAWVSGAAILPVLWFEGISGYFLVWDETAQIIAISLADIMEYLPINVEPVARNFLTNTSVNSLLFFVMNYLHLAIPGLLLILAWVHCMRISMPLINPPKQVTITILVALLGLSLVKPAVSAPPADLLKLVGDAPVDWFYMPMFPFLKAFDISAGEAWIGGIILFALFTAMPWIVPDPRKSANQKPVMEQNPISVHMDDCKGCMLCQEACPFEAMKIVPSESGAKSAIDIVVAPSRCAECGFCVNACEFGAVSMGDWDRSTIQDHIESLLEPDGYDSKPSTIAFICERSFNQDGFFTADNKRLASNNNVASMVIPCIGTISPALIDYSLNAGAKGVFIISCQPLDCHYREARHKLPLSEDADPNKFLIENVDHDAVKVYHAAPFASKIMIDAIDKFDEDMRNRTNSGGNNDG